MRTPLRGIGPPGDNEVFDLTMGDNHRYAMWDAAYVLGSLSAVDRREFEAHMAHCPACREAVAELSGVPALLSQLDREEVAAINESGATVGAPFGDTGDVARAYCRRCWQRCASRRRRTRVTTWVASAAAAVVLGIGVLVGVQGHFSHTSAAGDRVGAADGTGRDQPADVDGVRSQPALGNVHQPAVCLPGSAGCAP